MQRIRFALSLLLAGTVAAPVAAQQAGGTPPPAAAPAPAAPALSQDAQPDDIIVEGYRDRKPLAEKMTAPPTSSTIRNRRRYDYAERLAKCAARSKFGDLARLRAVVDGEFNSPRHHFDQDRLVRTYMTCGESPTLLSFTEVPVDFTDMGLAGQYILAGDTAGGTPGQSTGSPLGWSIYDRGALTIAALKRFAPDLTLTRKQTEDPRVQARFNLREIPRNRLRLPVDYHYFETAVCMVRLEPQLAVRLALMDGPARLSDVQEALVDRAKACVGNARRVRVDPTQFRLYIADAVYRWAVAARDVPSLIPLDTAVAQVRLPAASPSSASGALQP